MKAIEEAERQLADHEVELARANDDLQSESCALEAARGALVAAVAALANAQSSLSIIQERCAHEQARRERLEVAARALADRESAAAAKASAAENLMVEQQARLAMLEGDEARSRRASPRRAVGTRQLGASARWHEGRSGAGTLAS